MANKITGWTGSGSRPGSRRRPQSKGTVYWIDLTEERDQKFKEFAATYGMEHRFAARALIAVAAGLLPPNFWEPTELGGFTGTERMNLIRQLFPKGAGHTNRAPHAVWKTTWDPRLKGAPGGIDYIGLLIEREKQKLEAIVKGKSELKDELEEQEYKEAQEYAKEQLVEIERQRRIHLLERGIIVTGRDDVEDNDFDEESGDEYQQKLIGEGKAISKARRVDRIRPTGEDIDPFLRERRKNTKRIKKLNDEEKAKLERSRRLTLRLDIDRAAEIVQESNTTNITNKGDDDDEDI